MGLIRRDTALQVCWVSFLPASALSPDDHDLFVPCIASVWYYQEHGLLMGFAITLTSLAVACWQEICWQQ